jgi:hypothetical protein
MDERKPEPLKLAPPSLKAAMWRARVESAEQGEALADLRQAETVRLELLEEAVRPVLDQAPADVELFDPGISHGERPRLFLDMISFVDLAHDRRTYRFFQDTRHGRVLIAESESLDRIVAAITNYVARRVVEREQALASDWRSRTDPSIDLKTTTRSKQLAERVRAGRPAPAGASPPPPENPSASRRGLLAVLGDIFSFLLMTIGSLTLCAIVAFAAYAAWSAWGRAFWTAHLGAAPF